MSCRCSILRRPDRAAIEEAIASGASNREVSRRFPGVAKDAVRSHRPHVGGASVEVSKRRATARRRVLRKLSAARVSVSIGGPDDVIEQLRSLYESVATTLAQAEALGDTRLALAAVREGRDLLQTFGKVFNMWTEGGTTVNIDASRKTVALLSKMDEADLRAFLRGERVLELSA